MLKWGKIIVYPGFFGMLALAVLSGAWKVLLPVAVAALCHEMGHFAALSIARTPVQGIDFIVFGVEIRADTQYLPYWADILCTLAGPAANFAAAILCGRWGENYLLAGSNLLQGIFNLLPVSGLDGSRAMHLLLSWLFDPDLADRICRLVEVCLAAAVCAASVWLVAGNQAGMFLFLVTAGILRNTVRTWWGK